MRHHGGQRDPERQGWSRRHLQISDRVVPQVHDGQGRSPREGQDQREDDHQPHPEARDGHEEHDDESEDVVGPGVSPQRPRETHGQADEPGEDHRHHRDLAGDGAPPKDELPDGLAAPERLSEISAQDVLEPVQILNGVRPIQAQAYSRGLQLLLAEDVASPTLPGDRGQGIAG